MSAARTYGWRRAIGRCAVCDRWRILHGFRFAWGLAPNKGQKRHA